MVSLQKLKLTDQLHTHSAFIVCKHQASVLIQSFFRSTMMSGGCNTRCSERRLSSPVESFRILAQLTITATAKENIKARAGSAHFQV